MVKKGGHLLPLCPHERGTRLSRHLVHQANAENKAMHEINDDKGETPGVNSKTHGHGEKNFQKQGQVKERCWFLFVRKNHQGDTPTSPSESVKQINA